MDKAVLDWGEQRFRKEIRKIANELAESFAGEVNMVNVNADVIVGILTRRFVEDPPGTYEEIGQKFHLGMKALQRIVHRAEERILDKDAVAGSALRIYRYYWELYKKYQTAQNRLKKKTQSVI
jgi:hypothetical protein